MLAILKLKTSFYSLKYEGSFYVLKVPKEKRIAKNCEILKSFDFKSRGK